MKKVTKIVAVVAVAALGLMLAATASADSTTVPGQTPGQGKLKDQTGPYPDGVVVGHYNSYYYEDASGDYYWDLGDGRIQGTVSSVDQLDQDTLTSCTYVVNYKGDFQGDAYLDTGHIDNHVVCKGPDGTTTYNWQIVHNDDPRWTGDGIPEWGGTWEYHVSTESGVGNIANPEHHVS